MSDEERVQKVQQYERDIDEALERGDESVLPSLFQQLEALNVPLEPNRSPDFFGDWSVWYTDCPPPSNGQLGPFQGTSGQVIFDDEAKTYQNLLKVPPNDWLTATLDGVWEEWDGTLLTIENYQTEGYASITNPPKNIDWGANHWKVTFVQLTIRLLGITLVQKEFPPNTSRVWRTTYMDEEIRIVRAGKTGRVEDEVVFFTKRSPAPLLAKSSNPGLEWLTKCFQPKE
eukprot:CAMPEP_0172472286 /NCGR_PEP_ID=MMETSP1065-20121228/68259_1 /TAXON_ID=265537 /ORGANISM="Amphiprora paludosa, Strain CCMP125" /LENGTH=228 /DNA_ID=CAMNT_0013230417 /DNA_START=392 /DNA_END=1078 /DNA_ORIENTATION=-